MNTHYNWKSLCSDANSFDGLRQELLHCGGKYILDGVRMPETCESLVCNIEFRCFRNGNINLLYSNGPVNYTGIDPIIAAWIANCQIEFRDFNELADFLLRFKNDVSGSSGDEELSETEVPPRPHMQYNRDNMTVNTSSRNYCIIDKDKLIAYINSEIFGQEENVSKIAHLVCNHISTKHKSRPLSIFLYGPTGVGKSAVVEKLVNGINKQVKSSDKYAYRPVDCTQFQDRHDISRLTGAAPGYIGYDEPGVFSILEDNPNTMFVFEEIEKAAPNVTEVIMQAMETGKQETNGKTLSNGKQYYDLSNSIIFFTSNIEVENKKRNIGFAEFTDTPEETSPSAEETNIARLIGTETKEAKEKLAATGRFRREVIGRMNAVMKFNQIPDSAIVDIAAKCISDIAEKEHLLYITNLGDDILQEFLDETATEVKQFGVRALRSEAQYYFSDIFREFSHSHDDYTHISVTGNLTEPEINVA